MKKQSIWDPYMDFQHSTLTNGLNIYSSYWNRPWMRVHFCVHSGSLEDPKNKEGLAHFVEHMIRKRSGSISTENIERMVMRTGGSVNLGSTNAYCTYFQIEIPIGKRNVEMAFELLSKILLIPLESKDFALEKSAILHEFKRKYPFRVKYDIAILRYANAYYGTRFYNFKDTLGNPESISSINMDDVEMFFLKRYVPANISIIGVGGMSNVEFVKMVNASTLSQSIPGCKSKLPRLLEKLPYPKHTETIIELSQLYPGMRIDLSSFDAYALIPSIFQRKALVILTKILWSILFDQLREKSGDTYTPYINWEFLGEAFLIHIGLLLDKTKLEEIRNSIILKSLENARNRKLFSRKKQHFVKSYLINDLNMEEVAEELQNQLMKFGCILSSTCEMEKYENLTVDDYYALIDYLSNPKRWWTMIQFP